jgi:hypothetical protein
MAAKLEEMQYIPEHACPRTNYRQRNRRLEESAELEAANAAAARPIPRSSR